MMICHHLIKLIKVRFTFISELKKHEESACFRIDKLGYVLWWVRMVMSEGTEAQLVWD